MLYAILCYESEDVVGGWSREQEAEAMARIEAVERRLAAAGRLGPAARLLPTTAAMTLRRGRNVPLVLDGPYADTREQLLGFFVVDCVDLQEAIDTAGDLSHAKDGPGGCEIRPLSVFAPGGIAAEPAGARRR